MTEAADFQALFEKALAGDADAQLKVAECYFFGRGVSIDETLSAHWYESAAERGNAAAQQHVAGLYWNGQGRPQNHERALAWYRKAAEQNYAPALSTLGYLYETGDQAPQDDAQAAYWYRRSFEHTDRILCLPDHEECFWIRKAAANDPLAQTIVGRLTEMGFGRRQSDLEAIAWYRKAAEQDFAEAERRLARMIREGKGAPEDSGRAGYWLARAARHGDVDAQNELAGL